MPRVKVFFIIGLAGAVKYFRYLKFGLSLVLVFIGVKMLLLKFILGMLFLIDLS